METIKLTLSHIRAILIGVAIICMLGTCQRAKAETRNFGERVKVQTDNRDYEIGVYGGVPRAIPLPNTYGNERGPLVDVATNIEDFTRLLYAWCRHHYLVTICGAFLAFRAWEKRKLGLGSTFRASLAKWLEDGQTLQSKQAQQSQQGIVSRTGIQYAEPPVKHGA